MSDEHVKIIKIALAERNTAATKVSALILLIIFYYVVSHLSAVLTAGRGQGTQGEGQRGFGVVAEDEPDGSAGLVGNFLTADNIVF